MIQIAPYRTKSLSGLVSVSFFESGSGFMVGSGVTFIILDGFSTLSSVLNPGSRGLCLGEYPREFCMAAT
jgi:hypothetical protein